MEKDRVQAFSDGVIAILITIMVLGRDVKGKISPAIYAVAIPLAFVNRWISVALYVVVALMWLVPDRRIESRIDSA